MSIAQEWGRSLLAFRWGEAGGKERGLGGNLTKMKTEKRSDQKPNYYTAQMQIPIVVLG